MTFSISPVAGGACAALLLLLMSCQTAIGPRGGAVSTQRVTVTDFGELPGGGVARAYTLRNSRGTEAILTDLGATLVALEVADRDGNLDNVVLGFDDAAGYLSDRNQYFGCTAGRVANRIALGRFELDGEAYQLATNNPPNHLHGGDVGFGQRLWTASYPRSAAQVTFRYVSPDGEEGYPGEVACQVTYSLTENDELILDYRAESDAATPLNLTHHSYFNLSGAGHPTVLDHVLEVPASRYTPTDDTLIPTGEVAAVAGTPLDFRSPTRIGDRIASLDDTPAIGYDHNYAVRDRALPAVMGEVLGAGPVAVLVDPDTGRKLELFSNQPGLQFYSGNFLFGQAGRAGFEYAHRSACCLETQGWPDAINQPTFPSTVLLPGGVYRQLTVHRFSTDSE